MKDFEQTTDVNGKPIPRWQERLEGMCTEGVPFGEILSYVRHLLDETAVNVLLDTPDDVILANSPNADQFATEMRQKFDVISRLVRERDALRAALQSITLYPIQYDAPLTNDDLWGIISEMQGMAAGAIVDRAAVERVHALFMKKLAELEPGHPWLKEKK